jgi:hypothetical protein
MELLGKDQKLVLQFQGKDKTMICNKTNANRIAYLYGEDTDGWIGREIVLCSEFVEYQGRTVKGLRVKPPTRGATSHAAPPPPKVTAAHNELNPPPHDDIPF